jgi:hypothetical protein
MSAHKIYSALPEGNTKADLFPGIYFNFALEQIKNAEEGLNTYDDGCQYLLVNLDMLITICKKYPNMASRKIRLLKRKQLQKTFYSWYDRCNKKIPAKYREGIKESADNLFKELFEIRSWFKSE